MYFVLLESHVGGAVIRLFTSPVTRLYQTRAALEAAVRTPNIYIYINKGQDRSRSSGKHTDLNAFLQSALASQCTD
jgi:hypothetical protein